MTEYVIKTLRGKNVAIVFDDGELAIRTARQVSNARSEPMVIYELYALNGLTIVNYCNPMKEEEE